MNRRVERGCECRLPEFGWDCDRCRVGKRLRKADVERARGLFKAGKSLGDIGREMGFRSTSLAYKLFGREVGEWYSMEWNMATADPKRHGCLTLDRDNKVLKKACEWADYERRRLARGGD